MFDSLFSIYILQHLLVSFLNGYQQELNRVLQEFQKSHPQVKIIQDCAHSFSAQWNGAPVLSEGEAAIFGLNLSKTISSVFGGMVTTNNDQLANEIRTLRQKNGLSG